MNGIAMHRLAWVMAILLLAACRGATCPEGLLPEGDRCVPASSFDAGVDASTSDASDTDAGCRSFRDMDGDGFGDPNDFVRTCPPPTGYVDNPDDCDDADPEVNPDAVEICNGIDDDCSGEADDPFDCVQNGTDVPCTTSCGSTGVGSCDASCELTTECVPPAETCNYVDDDCEGGIDRGLHSLIGAGGAYGGTTNALRTWTFGGTSPVVFTLYEGGALQAQRFDDAGSPVGSEQLVYLSGLELALANFIIDIVRSGEDYILVAPDDEASRIEAVRVDGATLMPTGEAIDVVSLVDNVQSVAVAADDSFVLFAYTVDDSISVRGGAADLSSLAASSVVVGSDATLPVRLLARPGSIDWWLAYSFAGPSRISPRIQRIRPNGNTVGGPITLGASLPDSTFPTFPVMAMDEETGNLGVLFAHRVGGDVELHLEVRRGSDASLIGGSALGDPWAVCLLFSVPYCRPSDIIWSGSRWLVTQMTGESMESTRTVLRSFTPEGEPMPREGGGEERETLFMSSDQIRMASAARLASGAVLVTVPTPTEPVYRLWGCP